VGAALGWGAVAASSLVFGALLGMARTWPGRLIGLVLAFGAGALISAVSFQLAAEGIVAAGTRLVALGLATGALTYFVCDLVIERKASSGRAGARVAGAEAGVALALGAFLDGIPEQLVLGIGLAAGEGVGVALLVAIFVSNLPEGIGSASGMRAAGHPPSRIAALWIGVAVLCTLATVAGYALADATSGGFKGTVNGFAAGSLLVMLIDSMIPEAAEQSGRIAGLAATLGFALATALSALTA
jgi:ZIP family zinc transporter